MKKNEMKTQRDSEDAQRRDVSRRTIRLDYQLNGVVQTTQNWFFNSKRFRVLFIWSARAFLLSSHSFLPDVRLCVLMDSRSISRTSIITQRMRIGNEEKAIGERLRPEICAEGLSISRGRGGELKRPQNVAAADRAKVAQSD